MLRRKILDRLMEWKGRPNHGSLLLTGARQVGRTYIIMELAKTYVSSVYFDLMLNRSLRDVLDAGSDVETILDEIIRQRPDQVLKPHDCLIVIDEIQQCDSARASIEALSKDGRFDVVATGPMLDIRAMESRNGTSPPVCDELMIMRGLDFEEFLWALGYREELIDDIKRRLHDGVELGNAKLDAMSYAFKLFMIIGGMPKNVQRFVDGGKNETNQHYLDNLITTLCCDATRYASTVGRLRFHHYHEFLPSVMHDTDGRFRGSRIGRRRPLSETPDGREFLIRMEDAGLGYICYQLKHLGSPASESVNRKRLKFFYFDTGMFIRMTEGNSSVVVSALMEEYPDTDLKLTLDNAVAVCLINTGFTPCFYRKEDKEDRIGLDFVIDIGSDPTVIEVDSNDRDLPSSLTEVMHRNSPIRRWIVLGDTDVHIDDDGIEHYPLFAAQFMKELERSPREDERLKNRL